MQFGGDPGHVVLGGDSAGAESITLQMTAFGGAPTNLFQAVIGESQSFPTTLTVPQAQFQYDALVQRVGCANASDTLACLRSTPVSIFQNANIAIPFPGRNLPPDFLYNAVIDGSFLIDFPFRLFSEGKFVKVPSVFGYVLSMRYPRSCYQYSSKFIRVVTTRTKAPSSRPAT